MKLSQGRLEQLMAYADGELSGNERLEVEALLSESEDARQFLVELGHLGGFLRDGWQESAQAKKVATFDIADDVMKAVQAEAPAEAKAPVVRSLEEARQRRAAEKPAAGNGGLKIGGAVIALFAAAAAIAVFARQPAETPVAHSRAPATATGTRVAEPAGAGVEVEAVESPGSSVSVFHLPGASELSTSVVVWVEETGDKP